MFMDSSTPLVIKVWDSNPGRMIERQICLLTTKKTKRIVCSPCKRRKNGRSAMKLSMFISNFEYFIALLPLQKDTKGVDESIDITLM